MAIGAQGRVADLDAARRDAPAPALSAGLSMAGGPDNPLGARAMYLYDGERDTIFRIHGSNEPWTIGHAVSSGCIRMRNEDVIELYGASASARKVVVM